MRTVTDLRATLTGALSGGLSSALSSALSGRTGAYLGGLAGQGFNFLAMLVALALAPSYAVVNLVLTAAIATSLLQFGVLALTTTYPVFARREEARDALVASWCFLVLVGVLTLGVGVVLLRLGYAVGAAVCFSPVLLVTMALDSTIVAEFVRHQNALGVARNRFRYGTLNLVITTVVAATSDWAWSLVASGAAVYLATAVWVFHSSGMRWSRVAAGAATARPGPVARYAVRNVAHASSYLVNGAANQVSAFALPGLGRAAGPWAAMTSIAGGFGSVLFQLVVPAVDSSVAEQVRSGRSSGRGRTVTLGVLAGLGLAAVAVTVAVAGTYLFGYFDQVSRGQGVSVVVALVLYWGSAIAITPISHVMSLVGMRVVRIVWDYTRAVALFGVLLLGPGGVATLVWLGVVSLVFAVVHVALVLLVPARAAAVAPVE